MPDRLEVPAILHRNSSKIAVDGIEETGRFLIELATLRLGLDSLQDTDVLDIGCGVRFTQVLVNQNKPVRSYTGVEVHRPIVDFLSSRVEATDPRFRYAHWDVFHSLYNQDAPSRMSDEPRLPVSGTFDVIWMFSVLTHLEIADATALLKLARQVIRPTGQLLFTAFIDPAVDRCEPRGHRHPLQSVFYGRTAIDDMIREANWTVRAFHPGGPRPFIQPCFVCVPADS